VIEPGLKVDFGPLVVPRLQSEIAVDLMAEAHQHLQLAQMKLPGLAR